MSRLFILFLIALLPLRGWTVERMVIQSGTQSVAAQAQSAESAVGEDCALHMQQGTGLLSTETTHHSEHKPVHKGCQNCQLCMPLVALDATHNLALAPIAQALPVMGSSRFASAECARCVKPPIS
jgi:hypothetical protein